MSAVQMSQHRIPRSLYIVAGVSVAGLAGGFAIASTHDAANPWSAAISLGVFGLIAALALVAGWSSSKPFTLVRRVPIAPEELRRYAAWWFGDAPWMLARNDEDHLVYWRRTEPAAGTVIVLLFFGVIPGILYYFMARGKQRISISIQPAPAPGGADLQITAKPQGSEGRKRVIKFYNSLHQLVET
jgi:hypothetical protein